MKPQGTLLFEEEQHFDPREVIYLPVVLVAIAAAAPLVVYHFVMPAEAKSEARLTIMLASLGILVVGIPMVVLPGWLMRVITEVRTGGVFVRPWPMPFKRVDLDNASSVRAVTYNKYRYYDAKDLWRLLSNRKRALAARGDRAVLIEYADGSSMLIGTQAPDRLLRALETLRGTKG
jgi:hypothetical protein